MTWDIGRYNFRKLGCGNWINTVFSLRPSLYGTQVGPELPSEVFYHFNGDGSCGIYGYSRALSFKNTT